MEEQLKEIEKIREIPFEVKKIIDKKVYINVLIATVIMAVCVMLLVGYKHIEPNKYINILRVISVLSLFGTIFMIEFAYKRDNGELALNAVETIIIAITLLSFPYIYTYNIFNFHRIIVAILALYGAYYASKGIVTIFREREKYRKSLNDIKEITKE